MKIRRKPPKRRDGGDDFRHLEGGEHVPKNMRRSRVAEKQAWLAEVFQELDELDEDYKEE